MFTSSHRPRRDLGGSPHPRPRPGVLTLATAALAASSLAGPVAEGASSDLDPGFGTGGVVVVDDASYEGAYGMALQPDGKIIAVGYTTGAVNQDALVFRLDRNGVLDPGFGYRRLDVAGHGEAAYAAAIQPDGKIVVAGRTTKNGDAAVWRLLATGAPDPTFGGGDGLTTIDSSSHEYARDVAMAPDGKIVVVGYTTGNGNDATVYRLTTEGDLDPTFDADGALGLGDAGNDFANAVAVQPNGKILLTGSVGATTDLTVLRLDVNGAPDQTFGGGDGAANVTGVMDRGTDLALQPDGRIVVVSEAYRADYDGIVARLTATGQVDSSFGGPTGTTVDLGADESIQSISLLPSGGVVALGYTGAGDDPFVTLLDESGEAVTSFGDQGSARVPGLSDGWAVAAQPDGKVVVAGEDGKSDNNAVVYRFLANYQTPQAPVVHTCSGRPATIVGTAGRDRIVGTRRADVIVALGGNDVVKAGAGNDVVCAGDGKDTVLGGPGKDTLRGEKGADRLVGGAGKDRLLGGPDRDSLTQ